MQGNQSAGREPVFNVPLVVTGLIAAFVGVHLLRQFGGNGLDEWIMRHFSFVPARLSPSPLYPAGMFPGGAGAMVWTFVTYMFLHGDWTHLIVNSVWMLAFGAVAARRLGPVRFLVFSLVGAVFSALANLFMYWGEVVYLIGASGAISAQMGGVVRLMYAVPGGLGNLQRADYTKVVPLSLTGILRNRQAMVFIVIWVAINIAAGMTGIGAGENIGRIAWEAHLGGFVAGLLLFGWFDPGPERVKDYQDYL